MRRVGHWAASALGSGHHLMGRPVALTHSRPSLQWAVVGDTFPVGCRPQASVVFCDSTFQDNPDLQDPVYR